MAKKKGKKKKKAEKKKKKLLKLNEAKRSKKDKKKNKKGKGKKNVTGKKKGKKKKKVNAKPTVNTQDFNDHSSNYSVLQAVKMVRSLETLKQVEIFIKGEPRKTILRVLPGVRRKLGSS